MVIDQQGEESPENRQPAREAPLRVELLWIAPTLGLIIGFWIVYLKLFTKDDIEVISNAGIVFGVLLAAVLLAAAGRIWKSIISIGYLSQRLLGAWKWVVPVSSLFIIIPVAAVPPFGSVVPFPIPSPSSSSSSSPPPPSGEPTPPVDDTISTYLSGKVKIGVNGCLPGWSFDPGTKTRGCSNINTKNLEGFDIELATFLGERFGFEPEFVALTQQQRLDTWKSVPGTPEVKLVISTFSITPDRLRDMDFAGPYYYDVSDVWRNSRKPQNTDESQTEYGCAVNGTTGYDNLKAMEDSGPFNGTGNFKLDQTGEHLGDCLKKYRDPRTKISYVASDWSILQAYDNGVAVVLHSNPNHVVTDQEVRPTDLFDLRKTETYGIAFRNNHPNVCRKLTEAINDFLSGSSSIGISWETAWDKHLKNNVLNSDWHKPSSGNFGFCGL